MKRFLTILMLLAALTLVLSACAAPTTDKPATTEPATTGEEPFYVFLPKG